MNSGVDRATERFAPIQSAASSRCVRFRQRQEFAQLSRTLPLLADEFRAGYVLAARNFGRWLVAGPFPVNALLVADNGEEHSEYQDQVVA